MRTTSFILAFAFIMAGPSMAGSSEQGLPGVGTFAYNGSPVAVPALPADGCGCQVRWRTFRKKIADKGPACSHASVLP